MTNRLLEATASMIEAESANAAFEDRIGAALLVGDYAGARKLLAAMPVREAGVALRALLPEKSFSGWKEFARLYRAVTGKLGDDLFHAVKQLARLIDGIHEENIPKELKRRRLWLEKKASFIARSRAIARRGPPLERPVQQFNDCWVRILYELPKLSTFRQGQTYDEFLAAMIAEFPEHDIKTNGLGFQEFRSWLAARQLKAVVRVVNEDELATLLAEQGPLMGAIGWFDQDVAELRPTQALRHFHQHAILVMAATGVSGQRLFAVHDPLLSYESSYLMTEFDLLQLFVYVLESA